LIAANMFMNPPRWNVSQAEVGHQTYCEKHVVASL
jgi:hypothetical protein